MSNPELIIDRMSKVRLSFSSYSRDELGRTDMSYYIASYKMNKGIYFGLIHELNFPIGICQLKWLNSLH